MPISPNSSSEEADEICVYSAVVSTIPVCSVLSLDDYSSFSHLIRVTGWILRFINNCRSQSSENPCPHSLSTAELKKAETLWLSVAQAYSFSTEIVCLRNDEPIPGDSSIRSLHPFVDCARLLRVGGRVHNSPLTYSRRHPVILHGMHSLTKLIIRAEHIRLLHAGPTLVSSSLGRRFHIVGQRNAVRSITRACVVCRRTSARPQPQIMGQLPIERVTPGIVFENVGIDYAGPVYIKLGRVRKPTLVKAYICLFVAMSVKAVHLELISELTSAGFVACLRRFIARRGKPNCMCSDHGSNFIGASRELSELSLFLENQISTGTIPDFCASQGISWSFIPERSPHFGGLWESAVKSVKTHLKKIVGDTKLTFEELSTILTQIEASDV